MFQITVIFTLIVQRFLKIKIVGKKNLKKLKTRFYRKIKKNVYKRLLQLWYKIRLLNTSKRKDKHH